MLDNQNVIKLGKIPDSGQGYIGHSLQCGGLFFLLKFCTKNLKYSILILVYL